MSIKNWFLDGHPQGYHLAALLLAMVALSIALTTTIIAEEDGGATSNTTGSTPTTCSFEYSSWGECQPEGKRYRSVEEVSPEGCTQSTAPILHDACTYALPSCDYTYSSWGECQSNGKQSRSVTGQSPSNCTPDPPPVLNRSCTYTAPLSTITTTTSATSTTSTTNCSYTYTSWSSCQPDGKRYRGLESSSPAGCTQTTAPKLYETCTYTPPSSSQTTSTIPTDTTDTSTASVPQRMYSYSTWGNCESNGKRTRTLILKYPSGCAEFTKPVYEQSCIYDTTTSSVTTTNDSTTTAPLSGAVTPTFVFSNVSDGTVWKETVLIRGEVSGAERVEYYLIPIGSNIFKYIGNGRQEGDRQWVVNFRTTEFPNGEYYLRAKIKNRYGEYGSGQRQVRIVNTVGALTNGVSPEEEDKIVEETNKQRRAALVEVIQELGLPMGTVDVERDVNEQKEQIFSYCETNPIHCFPERDSDQDGLNDIDEIRFGTNPKGADSDWDGFMDGDEVKNGFDPAKYSPGDQSDRIIFESPKVTGEVKSNYVVDTVKLTADDAGKKKIHLTGKGLPNSFVTLYIYSEPIVLTVKTDSEGNWVYELDKELEDGEHEVYVAITDNTGKITGKSEPLAFVKTAQAVTVIPTAAATPADTLSVSEHRSQRDLFLLISISTAGTAIALAMIGFIKHRHNTEKGKVIIFPQS